jgi:hypothetical protein
MHEMMFVNLPVSALAGLTRWALQPEARNGTHIHRRAR